jgi:hypothetical protein
LLCSAEAPAAQALGTLLMVGLARAIYNPRPGEYADKLRDPAELCDFANRSAIVHPRRPARRHHQAWRGRPRLARRQPPAGTRPPGCGTRPPAAACAPLPAARPPLRLGLDRPPLRLAGSFGLGVAFSPDGRLLATASVDGATRLWV